MILEVFQWCGCPARDRSQQRGEFLYIFGSLRIRLLLPKASGLCRHQKISNLPMISDKSPFCVRGDVQSSILNIRQIKHLTCARVGRFLSLVLFPVKIPCLQLWLQVHWTYILFKRDCEKKPTGGKERCNQRNYWGKLREEEDIEKSKYFYTFLSMRYALLTGCRFLELLGWERPSLTSLTILQGPLTATLLAASWTCLRPCWLLKSPNSGIEWSPEYKVRRRDIELVMGVSHDQWYSLAETSA